MCGDLNVAHNEIDLKNPKQNRTNAGFTDEEREKMTTLLSSGFVDTYRYMYPEKVGYTWWSYMRQAREKNIGWRIDYFVVSDRLKTKIEDAYIYPNIISYNINTINEKIKMNCSFGYKEKDIIEIIKVHPFILSYSKENIENKFLFFKNLNFTNEEIIKNTKRLPALFDSLYLPFTFPPLEHYAGS